MRRLILLILRRHNFQATVNYLVLVGIRRDTVRDDLCQARFSCDRLIMLNSEAELYHEASAGICRHQPGALSHAR